MDVKSANKVGSAGAAERPSADPSRESATSPQSAEQNLGDKVSISDEAQKHSAGVEAATLSKPAEVAVEKGVSEAPSSEKESGVKSTTQEFFSSSQTRVERKKAERQVVNEVEAEVRREEVSDKIEVQAHQAEQVQRSDEQQIGPSPEAQAERQILEAGRRRDQAVREQEGFGGTEGGSRFKRDLGVDIVVGADGNQHLVAAGMEVVTRSGSGDPEAVARQMDEVRKAALASLDPSPHERAVALRAVAVENKVRAQLNETRAQIHRNDIGIGAEAATAVMDAARAQAAPPRPVESESEAKVVEKSEEPGSIGSSEGEAGATPLVPLLDPLRAYQKNVEAMSEIEEDEPLKDILG